MLELRPYQKEIVDNVNKRNEMRSVIVCATGLGKTVIFSRFDPTGRILILSHRDELVRQPQKYFKEQGISFGVEKADQYATDEQVVSASVQSFYRESRLKRYSPDDFRTIIIDEAHHCTTNNKTYKTILDYFTGAKKIIGVTATPRRGDHIALNLFDDIICNYDLRFGINAGYLVPIKCCRVKCDYTLSDVRRTAGDYNLQDLEQIMTTVLGAAAKTYKEICYAQNKHTLMYCVTKRQCYALQAMIRDILPEEDRSSIQVITGDTPQEQRNQIIKDFSTAPNGLIINCMVLTEGTDIPICDCICNLRPTENASLFVQIVGRGTRLYEGKDDCLVIDFVPKNGEPRNLCTTPTLFGVDPSQLSERKKEKMQNQNIMAFCDTLNGNFKNIEEHITVRLEQYEEYVTTRVKVVKGLKGNNEFTFQAMLKEFQNLDLKETDETEVFGDDLIVKTNSDDSHYYMIQPTFSDCIYISKPDLVGNVMVEFHLSNLHLKDYVLDAHPEFADKISALTKELKQASNEHKLLDFEEIKEELLEYEAWKLFHSGVKAEMRLTEAVDLVKRYCALTSVATAWSKSAREQWKSQPLTSGQYGMLLSRCESHFDECPKDINSLNKYDASYLIDILVQLESAIRFSKEYDFTKYKTPKAISARIKKYKSAFGKIKESDVAIEALKAYIQTKENAKKEDADIIKKDNIVASPMPVQYKIYKRTGIDDKPSERQLAFYHSLLQSLMDKGISIKNDELMKANEDIEIYVSVSISILKKMLERYTDKVLKMEIDYKDVIEAVEEVRRRIKDSDVVSIIITVKEITR